MSGVTLKDDASRRFLALNVGEVSLVGEPANECEWLVAKAKTEEAMSEAKDGVERVTVKDRGGEGAELVLKEVNGIIDTVCKHLGAKPPANVEVSKDTTMLDIMKAAGMTEEQLTAAKKAAAAKGLDLTTKMFPPKAEGDDAEEEPAKPGKGKEPKEKATKTTKSAVDQSAVDQVFDQIHKAKAFTPGRVEKLRALKGVVEELLGDVDPPSDRVPANLPAGKSPDASEITSTTKGKDGAGDDLMSLVTKALKPVVDKVDALSKELTEVKKARPASGSLEREGGTDSKGASGASGGEPVKKSFWSGAL